MRGKLDDKSRIDQKSPGEKVSEGKKKKRLEEFCNITKIGIFGQEQYRNRMNLNVLCFFI